MAMAVVREETSTIPPTSDKFIQTLVGNSVKVVNYAITSGTKPGENFMSILFCIEIETEEIESGKTNTVHYISKCYPTHRARQEFLKKSNLFWKELCVYKILLPEFENFGKELEISIDLPFAPFIGGNSIDFGDGSDINENIMKYKGKLFDPFDNYLVMVDMKKTHGFRTANPFLGFSKYEFALAMEELAKIHALSLAYKHRHELETLSQKFPFIKSDFNETKRAMWVKVMNGNCQLAIDTLTPLLGPESEIVKGVQQFKNNLEGIMEVFGGNAAMTTLDNFLRVKLDLTKDEIVEDNVPLNVLIHGDCWINNLLFQYDEITSKAVRVVLIDLPIMKEACPTLDLAYLVYTGTTAKFRRNYLDQMLRLYYDNFVNYCQTFRVESSVLSAFHFEGFKRRFHRAKIIGLLMAMMDLPGLLKDPSEVQDMELTKYDGGLSELFLDAMGSGQDDRMYQERIWEIAREMFLDGII